MSYPLLELVPALDVHAHVVKPHAREQERVIARRLLPPAEADHETRPHAHDERSEVVLGRQRCLRPQQPVVEVGAPLEVGDRECQVAEALMLRHVPLPFPWSCVMASFEHHALRR
ncbi:MAG: hypothetical protein M3256_24785 [Actinomycetota bacterium]|nr:hypothetical protein [Actinomycetota bacterium]